MVKAKCRDLPKADVAESARRGIGEPLTIFGKSGPRGELLGEKPGY